MSLLVVPGHRKIGRTFRKPSKFLLNSALRPKIGNDKETSRIFSILTLVKFLRLN